MTSCDTACPNFSGGRELVFDGYGDYGQATYRYICCREAKEFKPQVVRRVTDDGVIIEEWICQRKESAA